MCSVQWHLLNCGCFVVLSCLLWIILWYMLYCGWMTVLTNFLQQFVNIVFLNLTLMVLRESMTVLFHCSQYRMLHMVGCDVVGIRRKRIILLPFFNRSTTASAGHYKFFPEFGWKRWSIVHSKYNFTLTMLDLLILIGLLVGLWF